MNPEDRGRPAARPFLVLVNPPAYHGTDFIREGRCMQSSDSWATPRPPITLSIMASIAEPHMDVKLFDFIIEGTPREEAAAKVVSFSPDLIVINTGFPSIEGDMRFAGELKRMLPDSVIISFGVFFTLLGKEGLEYCPQLDGAIFGEPEKTFQELARSFPDSSILPKIDGMLLREGDEILSTSSRPLIADLDTLPHPNRELLENRLYILPNNGRRFTLINSARGCPFGCSFCIAPIYYGRKVRRHSIDYIMEEIRDCVNNHSIQSFLFWEESFTSDREYCLALCNAMERMETDLDFAATTRAADVDRELLQSMKKAGCMLLGLGIETASQEILDRANKNEKLEDIERAVRLCREAGIPAMGHFIFGLPGETPETAVKTINYALELGLDYVQAYCAVPYPGTELGELAREKGWITAEKWEEYDFGGRSVMKTDSIRPEQVNLFRQKLLRSFYMRPSYIVRKLREIGSLKRLLKVSSFVKWIRGSG